MPRGLLPRSQAYGIRPEDLARQDRVLRLTRFYSRPDLPLHVCFYCGGRVSSAGSSFDHVPPLSALAKLSDEDAAAAGAVVVPACRACNLALGALSSGSLDVRCAWLCFVRRGRGAVWELLLSRVGLARAEALVAEASQFKAAAKWRRRWEREAQVGASRSEREVSARRAFDVAFAAMRFPGARRR